MAPVEQKKKKIECFLGFCDWQGQKKKIIPAQIFGCVKERFPQNKNKIESSKIITLLSGKLSGKLSCIYKVDPETAVLGEAVPLVCMVKMGFPLILAWISPNV